MSMELDFWIPNLSAEAASISRLEKHLENDSNEYFRIVHKDKKIVVTAKEDSNGVHSDFCLNIEILDYHGRCHLNCNRNAEPASIYIANEAWNAFRRKLDGCEGTIYDCSAVREPFNVFHGSTGEFNLHKNAGNFYIDMSNRFIQSVERISDTMNHIWSDGMEIKRRRYNIDVATRSLANAKANKLYFDSFLNIYGERFPAKTTKAKIKEMEFRMKKVEIAYDAITTIRNTDYESSMHTITVIALLISATALAADAFIGLNELFQWIHP